MSKKFKKLICGVLALAMLATSGITSLADETTAATTAETVATETVADTEATAEEATEEVTEEATEEVTEEATEEVTEEATEEAAEEATEEVVEEAEAEPTATPEPTAVPDPYAADAYYQKALGLCSALGIITGYDDGSVKPESTVTRAEMAAIILRMTALSSLSTYRNLYTDVTTSHWAADTIQTAADEGVINGMGDGTFNPDGEVLYEQAIKMVVCGMNYDNEATLKGGYPEGYIAVATSNLSLLDSVKGTMATPITRGEIIKMVYNALIGPYNDLKSYDGGNPVYDSTETLAKAKFDVFQDKGLLTGTSTTSIAGTTPAKGMITIDGEEFLCDLTNIDNLIANKITYYYVNDGKGDAKVIAILTDIAKTKEVTITSREIDEFDGFEDGAGEIETYAGKRYKTEDATVIYNDEFITPSLYNAVAAADDTSRFDLIGADGINYSESTGKKMTYDQFIKPRVGSVRLVDNDNDGKYDVMFVTSIETLLITAATEKKITGKINNEAVTLDVDTVDLDKTVTVTLDGSEAKPKNLKKNNVVSLKRNLNNDILTFTKVENTITGKISSVEAAEQKVFAVATINGQNYDVDVNALADAVSGVEGTFIFDQYNRLGYISSDSVITASEKYGWILSTYPSDSGDDYVVRLFTQDGKTQEFSLASKVNYWSPKSKSPASYTKSEMIKNLNEISYNVASVGGTTTDEDGNSVAMPPVSVRLVKFSVNSKNEIIKLYCSTQVDGTYEKGSEYSDADGTYDKAAVVMGATNMNTNSTGNMLGNKYYMTDGMLEITVPNSDKNMSDPSNYSVATVNASAYLNKENPIGKDCIFGEFSDAKQTYPTVVIRFVGAADEAVYASDYGTADNNPVMMVKKILTGYDDDDNEIFTVVGYQNGSEVRYTTRNNTTLAKFNGFNDKEYNMITLWNAVDGMTAAGRTNYPGADGISDILGEGDIVGVDNNGGVFLIFVDASDMAEKVKNGTYTNDTYFYNGTYDPGSVTRDNLHIGIISDSDMGDNAVMTVGTYKMVFDNARAIDTATVTASGTVKVTSETSTIADIEDFDTSSGTGDFGFVRYANKGSLQEIFLFRFEE